MSLMAKGKNFAGIKAQVLVSMVADLTRFDTPSYKEFWADKLTSGVDMEDMRDKYLQVLACPGGSTCLLHATNQSITRGQHLLDVLYKVLQSVLSSQDCARRASVKHLRLHI